jgi:hypothetical protein
VSSSPSPPSVPDPNVTAAQQQQYNTTSGEQSQQGSMVNQYNPYGSLTYSQTGTSASGVPIYSATENLSPSQQQLLTELTGSQTTAGQQAGNLLAGANYGSTSPATAIGNLTSGLTGQAAQQEANYLQPFFTPQTQQLDTQLRNQGINPGTPAYTQAMNNLQQSQAQTYTGYLASTEPQLFSQATTEYEAPAQLAESLGQYGAPANENSNLTQTPSLSIQPANLIGATSNALSAEQQTYQDQLAQQNAMMSGLFGVGSSVLGGWAKSGGLSSLLGAAAL